MDYGKDLVLSLFCVKTRNSLISFSQITNSINPLDLLCSCTLIVTVLLTAANKSDLRKEFYRKAKGSSETMIC